MGKKSILVILLFLLVILVKVLLAQDVFQAALEGDLEVVKKILAQNPDLVSRAGPHGKTALHFAAQGGHAAMVQLLLERGAAVDAANINGTTPLMYAAAGGHDQVIGILLEHGSDINRQQDGTGMTALFFAVQRGHEKTVRFLCDREADINHRDTAGDTPLIQAVAAGYRKIAEVLLEQGAEIFPGSDVWKLLHVGAFHGMTGLVARMIEGGADINSLDPYGLTPLDRAREGDRESVIELLFEKGAREKPGAQKKHSGEYPDSLLPGGKKPV